MTTMPDFQDLFENAPCGYLLLDPRGRITKSNRTLLAWLGFNEDNLSGKRLLDLMPVAGRMLTESDWALVSERDVDIISR